MRIVILCEGDTEEAILKPFLKPYINENTVVKIINKRGVGNLKQEFKFDTELELQDDLSCVVFCLLDLFEAPFKPPKEIHDSPNPITEMYKYIQSFMRETIDKDLRDRFFVFPVIQEIETWLLADPEVLHYFNSALTPYPSPESIAHPAEELKRLMQRYKQRDYKKVIDGSKLFNIASAQRIYDDNCPHFVEFINQLLEVQGIETPKSSPDFGEINAQKMSQYNELERKEASIWKNIVARNDMTDEEATKLDEIKQEKLNLWDS